MVDENDLARTGIHARDDSDLFGRRHRQVALCKTGCIALSVAKELIGDAHGVLRPSTATMIEQFSSPIHLVDYVGWLAALRV
jgi:hypothetical protein